MNHIFRQILHSREFIDEARKTTPGRDPAELRRDMVASLHKQVEAFGATLDAEDLRLESRFIDGTLDDNERRRLARAQFAGRLKPPR